MPFYRLPLSIEDCKSIRKGIEDKKVKIRISGRRVLIKPYKMSDESHFGLPIEACIEKIVGTVPVLPDKNYELCDTHLEAIAKECLEDLKEFSNSKLFSERDRDRVKVKDGLQSKMKKKVNVSPETMTLFETNHSEDIIREERERRQNAARALSTFFRMARVGQHPVPRPDGEEDQRSVDRLGDGHEKPTSQLAEESGAKGDGRTNDNVRASPPRINQQEQRQAENSESPSAPIVEAKLYKKSDKSDEPIEASIEYNGIPELRDDHEEFDLETISEEMLLKSVDRKSVPEVAERLKYETLKGKIVREEQERVRAEDKNSNNHNEERVDNVRADTIQESSAEASIEYNGIHLETIAKACLKKCSKKDLFRGTVAEVAERLKEKTNKNVKKKIDLLPFEKIVREERERLRAEDKNSNNHNEERVDSVRAISSRESSIKDLKEELDHERQMESRLQEIELAVASLKAEMASQASQFAEQEARRRASKAAASAIKLPFSLK